PRIVGAHDVIRDAEDVEPAAPVEVDELGDGQFAVAPPRVRVELAEQRTQTSSHWFQGAGERRCRGGKSGGFAANNVFNCPFAGAGRIAKGWAPPAARSSSRRKHGWPRCSRTPTSHGGTRRSRRPRTTRRGGSARSSRGRMHSP